MSHMDLLEEIFLFYFISFIYLIIYFYNSIGSKWLWIPPYFFCCIGSLYLWLCKVCQFVFGVGEAHHAECCSRASRRRAPVLVQQTNVSLPDGWEMRGKSRAVDNRHVWNRNVQLFHVFFFKSAPVLLLCSSVKIRSLNQMSLLCPGP